MALIAIFGLIAGTLGAWLVYTDLRDSKRRFDARRRLGLPRLSMFGDFPHVPADVQFGGRRQPGGEAGTRPAADAQGTSLTHSGTGL